MRARGHFTDIGNAHIFAHWGAAMERPESNTKKVIARLEREGWVGRHGTRHDIYKHPARPGTYIVVPRHRAMSPGVAREIAETAGWLK